MLRSLSAAFLVAGCATVPAPAPLAKLPAAGAFALPRHRLSAHNVVPSLLVGCSSVRAARVEPEDVAWSYLVTCTTHRRFSDLTLLVTDWHRELHTKREANDVLARVLSERGSLRSDLPVLQRHGIGVYDLSTA